MCHGFHMCYQRLSTFIILSYFGGVRRNIAVNHKKRDKIQTRICMQDNVTQFVNTLVYPIKKKLTGKGQSSPEWNQKNKIGGGEFNFRTNLIRRATAPFSPLPIYLLYHLPHRLLQLHHLLSPPCPVQVKLIQGQV